MPTSRPSAIAAVAVLGDVRLDYVPVRVEALSRADVDAVLQICDLDVECQLPEGGINAGLSD